MTYNLLPVPFRYCRRETPAIAIRQSYYINSQYGDRMKRGYRIQTINPFIPALACALAHSFSLS